MTTNDSSMANEKPVVAFLGPSCSYTHQATLEAFPEEQYDHVPVVNIRDVFQAVQSGSASLGVVPFENSTNGSVVFTLDLFADRHSTFPSILVCSEIYLDIHHYLLSHHSLGPPPSLTPSSSPDFEDSDGVSTPTANTPSPLKPKAKSESCVKGIERIYSHPQAFGQCEIFLNAHLKGVERVDVSSTSKAAELVRADETGTSAAISGKVAADVMGLSVLARGIEDREDNTTRFFVIRKGNDGESGATERGGEDWTGDIPGKTLVSFTVDHKSPGALADVLDVFRKYGLNLTSINSRPSLEVPFQYVFFVEFEGSRFRDPQGVVNRGLESLEGVAKNWRWLGSWDAKR